MHEQVSRRTSALALALAVALAGCQGSKGDTGQQGPAGESAGTITGKIQVASGAGVPGAVVTTAPLGLASAATGADGLFTIPDVPLGTYTLSVAGPSIAGITVANVVVVAGTTDVGPKTVVYSPMTITIGTLPVPVGFGKPVALSATVTGNTGALTYAWSQVSGPTTGAFDSTTSATPTFTTGTLEAMIAGGKLRGLTAPPARNGLLAFTAQQVTNSTYSLKLEVSDGTYTQSKTFSVVPAVVSAGQNAGASAYVPRNVIVMANTGTIDTAGGGWTLDTSGAAGSAAVLEGASTKNPWFIPDAQGTYVLRNGAAVVSTILASDWKGSTIDAPTASCGASSCHGAGGAVDLAVRAKFKAWSNSAHGNHFFKYFEWSGDSLVVKGDPTATSVVVPTATDGVTWTLTAPFRPITTFEFGLTGGEGNHYSESCMRCHTVGMNKGSLVVNAGIDDVTGYAFPDLGAPDATPAPVSARWDALAQGVRDRAGMQCESCHGPLNRHTSLANAPKAFFDAGTCGVCHDSGNNHNRSALWAQSGHANLTLAEEEGTSRNCGRCHSAQGFVAWSKVGFAAGTQLAAAPALADIEPVTCVACHDPHTTALRVDEALPITTTSGFTVSGAGAGQLCVICHSSRRGLHNDANAPTSYSLPHAAAQSDLFFGQNAYFFGALADGATLSTHAYVIAGTCVGCHMEKDLARAGIVPAPSVTNHTFRVDVNVCGKCHEGASFAALKERTEAGIAALKTELAAAARRAIPSTAGFRAVVPTVVPSISSSACNLVARFAAAPRPATAVLGMPTGHGAGFTFTWTADVQYTIHAADNAAVDCDSVTAGTQAISADIGPVTVPANSALGVPLTDTLTTANGASVLIPANGDLFKAWWNLALIEDEGSFGAHNPGFAQQVLTVSRARAAATPTAP